MQESLSILLNHGYLVVFLWVFADQAGLPLPALPVLLAAGALAAAGKLNFFAIVGLAAVAAMLSDTMWFEIGRRRGGSVLKFICRTSLEPDSCVGRTQQMFSKRGIWTLVVAKFVPGLNVLSSPMAGMSGISRMKFLAMNTVGALAFALAFVTPGYIFSRQLESILAVASASGRWMVVGIVAFTTAYIVFKYIRRLRFIRMLRVSRISPEQLKAMMETGARVVIVDLRLPGDFSVEPRTLPGAIRLAPQDVATRHKEIPRDQEVVLYCSCHDEFTSTRAALLLRSYGIHRVRPLAGGYDGWMERKFPLISLDENLKN